MYSQASYGTTYYSGFRGKYTSSPVGIKRKKFVLDNRRHILKTILGGIEMSSIDQEAIPALFVGQKKLAPYYYFQAQDSLGNAIDLTDATIYVTMKNIADGTLVINRQTAGVKFTDTGMGDDITQGKGHYEWQAGETDTAGRFLIEFDVQPLSGGNFVFPLEKDGIVMIKPTLSGV